MKTEKEILEQRKRINYWISSLDRDSNPVTVSHLCAYFDVLSWVLNDTGRWVEDYGLMHVMEEAKKC